MQHSLAIRRLGVFGGSFDPIHLGHLIAAECVRDALGLDLVLFVPAHRSPLKEEVEAAPAHRLEMVRLAVAGHPYFAVSTVDIDRPPPSYTVETLGLLRRQYAGAALYLIIGYDSYRELHRWRQPDMVVRLADLVVVNRPLVPPEDIPPAVREASGPRLVEWQRGARVHFVDIPLIGISSTEIRQRVREGHTITFQVPAAVEHYIKRHGLYRAAPSGATLKGAYLDGTERAACGGPERGDAPAR